ncbi:MAG TPA: TonB-dependent receptor [Croceicoccus sp.]|nr:TonB-dependent receptor [Croceicoccus sp.]
MRTKTLLLSSVLVSAAALSPLAAHAQDGAGGGADYDPSIAYAEAMPATEASDAIVVVATGIPIDVSETAQPISVIGLDEIASVQGPDLTRVLQRLPGTSISRNGGVGSFTGLRVRGASAEQLLVLIDGVKVNDVAAPGGGFDFGNVLAGNIERIELLRGPNSVIWGSDAIGGVMNLTTRVANGVFASGEYGSDETVHATIGGGVRFDALEAGISGSYMTSDGYSAARAGSEDDGFRQWQVTGRACYVLDDALALVANARYADGRLDQDGYPAPLYAFGDTDDVQDTMEQSGRVGFEYNGEALTLRGGLARSKTERVYSGESYVWYENGVYVTDGRADRAELFGQYRLVGPIRLDFGVDREWTRFEDEGATHKARTNSGHAMLGFYTPVATLAAGARYADHSRFGGEWTFGANGAVRLASDLRLRASYGEGFKAPSLYQLYSLYYGDLGLQPETSKGYDVGVEKGSRADRFFAAVSLFRRDSRNLIDFNLTSYLYYNIGKARAEGVEVELAARPSDRWRTGLVYSYVEASDRTAGSIYEGNDLNRRPRHAVTASVDWATPFGVELGADARMVGDAFDDRGELVRLDGYETVDLRAEVPLGPVELYGRVENLFDAGYETTAGYNAGGRSAYVGARLKL